MAKRARSRVRDQENPTSRVPRSVLIAVLATIPAAPALASYAYYVGKNLTESGGVLIGGTGEEVSSHWLEIVPAESHEDGATAEVGPCCANFLPAELSLSPPDVGRRAA